MKHLPFLVATIIASGLVGHAHASDLALPPFLHGKAQVLSPQDADYPRANVGAAVKEPGLGGISSGLVIRITQDLPAYRLWNGPDKLDSAGRTNRLGSWWSYDAPAGSVADYRTHYEVCQQWNDLTWVATCTLKVGAVVAIGPGQSVSAETCQVAGESYPAAPEYWQVYVDKPWSRPTELLCQDYPNNPDNIAQPKP